MPVLAFTAQKGGVGKTTLSTHTAAKLALEAPTCFLDADPQGSGARWMRDAVPSIPVEILADAHECFEKVPIFAREYRFVVVDSPPALADVVRACLMVCDVAILPSGPSALDVESVADTYRLLNQARDVRQNGLPRALLVPNRLRAGTRLSEELISAVDELKIPRSNAALHLREAFADARSSGFVWDIGRKGRDAAVEIDNVIREVIHAIPAA